MPGPVGFGVIKGPKGNSGMPDPIPALDTFAAFDGVSGLKAAPYTPLNKAGDTMTGPLTGATYVQLSSGVRLQNILGNLGVRTSDGSTYASVYASNGIFAGSINTNLGSASAPSISFIDATNSGLSCGSIIAGSRSVVISTDGSSALTLGGSGTNRTATFVGNIISPNATFGSVIITGGAGLIQGSLIYGSVGLYSASINNITGGSLIVGTTDSQSLNLRTNSTNRLVIDTNGLVTAGSSGGAAQLNSIIGNSSRVGFIVTGASGQSANLTEWKNNSGTVLSSVDLSGNFTLPNIKITTSPIIGYVWTCSNVDGSGSWQAGGNPTDGDKGDITVSSSGATWTIDNGVVSLVKMADMATASLLGRNTAGTGAPEVLSASTTKTLLSLNNVENTALSTWAGTSNITTLGTISTGTWNATAISNSKLANMAANTFKGNNTGSSAAPTDMTVAQARAILRGTRNTLTFNTSQNWDLNNGLIHQVTATNNFTLNFPSNAAQDETAIIYVTQDGTGNRLITLGANLKWAGTTAQTLSTAAGTVDRLEFVFKTSGTATVTLTKDV